MKNLQLKLNLRAVPPKSLKAIRQVDLRATLNACLPTSWQVNLLAIGLAILPVPSMAQEVFHVSDSAGTLKERWSLARKEARTKATDSGYWVGYSITRMMGEHSMMGCYYSDPTRNRPTLGELVTGLRKEYDQNGIHSSRSETFEGFIDLNDNGEAQQMIKKEVGILFHFASAKDEDFDNLRVSNLSLHVDLEWEPLYWIGSAEHTESVQFLEAEYANARTRESKKHLLMGAGIHNEAPEAPLFLKKVLTGTENAEVRGEAAFWLGQMDTREGMQILSDAAQNDQSLEVRDKCIFGLSQMKMEPATDALIALAKTHPDPDTRKKAIFWLSQKASTKALATIKEAAYKDESTEVEKSALFALTQFKDAEAVNDLITIANTHPNPKLRKEAIFWLGQSENPKALEAIIDILKK